MLLTKQQHDGNYCDEAKGEGQHESGFDVKFGQSQWLRLA